MDIDESSQSHQRRQPAILSSESTSDQDENADSSHGTDNYHSDGNNDLTDLNSMSLQKKITSEVKLIQFTLVYTIC